MLTASRPGDEVNRPPCDPGEYEKCAPDCAKSRAPQSKTGVPCKGGNCSDGIAIWNMVTPPANIVLVGSLISQRPLSVRLPILFFLLFLVAIRALIGLISWRAESDIFASTPALMLFAW